MGHAVAFPSHHVEGTLPANVDPAILLGAESLRARKESIDRGLTIWCPVSRVHPMTAEMREAILECVSSIFRRVPVLWRTIY